MVKQGTCARRIDHYSMLRTLNDMYGLPAIGRAVEAQPIDDMWTCSPALGA